MRRVEVPPADLAIAVGVAMITTLGTLEDTVPGRVDALGIGLLAAGGLTLAVRRRWPLTVFVLAAVLQIAYLLLGYPEGMDWLPGVVALGTVTWLKGWRWAVPLVLACLALTAIDLPFRGFSAFDTESLLLVMGSGCAVLVGEWLRTRRAYLAAVEERAALAERSKAEEARRLVDEERLRIAREVHDVVAHALASIAVQAGVGEHVGRRDPERAQAALAAIRRTSGHALDDLRATLGTLRLPSAPDPAADGGPGLGDVRRVLAGAQDAGIRTDLRVVGGERALPPAVELAAYRILQEAVTNTIKHAGATRLAVTVTYGPRHLELRVADDGRSAAEPGPAGHGLRGMHERVAQLGGSLTAGPPQGGGFAVEARLPLPALAEAAR